MNIETIFTVKNNDLEQLDEHKAVDFFRRLLWAEARRIGVEISKIHVSSAIHVADGGIDAAVDDAQINTGCGIIKPGKTSYQIKSGECKPWQPSFIKKALFRDGTPYQENLGASIRSCLDACGTYILVCTGIDLVESQRINAIEHIKKYLEECGYPNAEVEVWSQNNLISFLEFFPSLALQVNGNDRGIFQTHMSWSRDTDVEARFVPGGSQTELIANIQNELQRDEYPVHVRLWGEPGIGKTRLAFEATKTDGLSSLVIYSLASEFRDSVLMTDICREDNHFSAILVLDECDPDNRSYIWNKLRYYSPRIKLITIYNDYEDVPLDIPYYVTPRLEDEQIQVILRGYRVPTEKTKLWAELCSGSPRVAHVIGGNLAKHPEDLLRPPSTVNIWERYVVGNSDPKSQEVRERRQVLRYIALFKKFGFEKSVERDARAIAKKITAAYPQITWPMFQEIVKNLKKRKILQGGSTLYITPKALHIKLWTEWWDNHATTFNFDEFIQEFPQESELVDWFCDMFRYADESGVASKVVEELLGPNGPFRNSEYLKTQLGSRFFLALTEGDPKSALGCLVKTLGNWDRETLLQFREGRRNVVWALQKIAVWRDLFSDAARLLLALGEAENEGFSNNASGVFTELFTPAPGRVAPTEAPPSKRLPILEEAFTSDSKERRALALKACNIALESGEFVRFGSPEVQGLRKEPELWMPKTYGELWEAYRGTWKLLESQLPRLPEDERKQGAETLLLNARALTRIRNLSNMIADTVATIARKKYVDEKHVIEAINRILHYEGERLDRTTQERWEQLMGETGRFRLSFHDATVCWNGFA